MVIVFMETRYQELCSIWRQKPLSPGRTFVAMLKFWGEEFNFETTAIMVNPPSLIPKQGYLPVSLSRLASIRRLEISAKITCRLSFLKSEVRSTDPQMLLVVRLE